MQDDRDIPMVDVAWSAHLWGSRMQSAASAALPPAERRSTATDDAPGLELQDDRESELRIVGECTARERAD
jgi:hypothetical protein